GLVAVVGHPGDGWYGHGTVPARFEVKRATSTVADPAVTEWCAVALEWLRHHLQLHDTVFPPALWALGLPMPPNGAHRAIGSVIRRALRDGWMEPTGEYRRSASSNGAPKPVYRSLLSGTTGE